jgi:LmbE family N-acetylglucosaminyl deacetylase
MTEAPIEPTPTRPTPDLQPINEDWERALCVVAHPDDLEFGAAAAIARWTGQGKTVVYAMVTSGEAGIDGLDPDECRRVREAEQVESARIVGVDTVEFLGQPDGTIEYTVGLREVICAAVRKHRPDVVITNNFRDTWGGTALNQADHIATGKATLDAVRDAGNRWVFRAQIEADGLEPWGGVREVWASGSPNAIHAVDTTATFDVGVASLEAHKAYIDGLGWELFDPEEFLEGAARAAGTRLGVPKATTFEVFKMGWGD